ncbi:ABC transporter permease [Alkalicoccobacillus porphyridii]|uniref:ABC transporter permease n=1 Tax=Alkalicoccobacillus porphyridii TaxID=2597270 RepID=A0A553ZV13_9BACI|nr:ABC transporter permease [Alkalicoccobacillus porphyridii]TSB45328.1 ABC transporter permease [Alkalicoccobacillus porphyridii]
MILPTIKYTGIRISRDYIGLLLLFVLPILLIFVFSLILVDMESEGVRIIETTAISMVLAFQLFGGSFPMGYIQEDLFSDRKWRLKSLPINTALYAFSVLLAGTIFSILQGMVIVFITHFAFGVDWGSFFWALLVIALLSVISSLVCTICALISPNFKIAERLTEVFGVGSIILAGMFFSLPDNTFFNFMGTYGNPLSLAQTAIFERMNDGNSSEVQIALFTLTAAIIVCFLIMVTLGRKKIQ